MKESGLWVGFYVTLALIFGAVVWWQAGPDIGQQFIAGWVTEYSLSIDNLFVFIIIMARFSVPRKYQQEVLMFGIIIALILRGIFIILGAAVIENYSWVFYIFGAFLLWTAWKQATDNGEDESDGANNGLVYKLTKNLPISKDFDGNKLRTVIDGKKMFTPMVMVFVTIGMTDLLFAVDSIPAIFGLTQSPFIVFTANLFALMGLRQLYFLLGGLMDRLVYLKHALSIILAFIGVKLVFHAMHVNELPFINGGEHDHSGSRTSRSPSRWWSSWAPSSSRPSPRCSPRPAAAPPPSTRPNRTAQAGRQVTARAATHHASGSVFRSLEGRAPRPLTRPRC